MEMGLSSGNRITCSCVRLSLPGVVILCDVGRSWNFWRESREGLYIRGVSRTWGQRWMVAWCLPGAYVRLPDRALKDSVSPTDHCKR